MAERNPYHVPAGSSIGGQFTSGQLNAIGNAARTAAGLNKFGSSRSEIEKNIRREKTEQVFLYDSQGNLIYHDDTKNITGHEGEAPWMTDPGLKSKAKGGVITHNHPQGSSFSPDDILHAGEMELSEIRVVTDMGKLFSMKPKNSWPTSDEIDIIIKKVGYPYKWDDFWQDTHKKLGLIYKESSVPRK